MLDRSGKVEKVMARTAKCKICGRVLNTNEAFKIEGKPNKYFCSEGEWQAEEERKKKVAEDKDRVYRLICDIMGEREIINSALFKEWAEWNKVADNVKIARYLEENKDYLTTAISHIENKIYNRIRYLSAILKNALGDYIPKVVNESEKVQSKVVIEEHYETKYKPKVRKALLDFEEDYDGE